MAAIAPLALRVSISRSPSARAHHREANPAAVQVRGSIDTVLLETARYFTHIAFLRHRPALDRTPDVEIVVEYAQAFPIDRSRGNSMSHTSSRLAQEFEV